MKCKCGCGNEIPKTPQQNENQGYRKRHGLNTGYIRGHWNKEQRKDIVYFGGYAYFYRPNHPNAWKLKGYIKRSRILMSEYLGRPLTDNEIVHHINGDKTDDRIENLVITQTGRHTTLHKKGKHNRQTKQCPTCGELFIKRSEHHKNSIYCSPQCAGKKGEKNPLAKLTEEKIKEIRKLKGIIPYKEIASKYNVSEDTIFQIQTHRTWKHITP